MQFGLLFWFSVQSTARYDQVQFTAQGCCIQILAETSQVASPARDADSTDLQLAGFLGFGSDKEVCDSPPLCEL